MDNEPSRTQQLRTEIAEFTHSQGRSFADMFVVVESRAWRRGFLAGFMAVGFVAVVGVAIWYWGVTW